MPGLALRTVAALAALAALAGYVVGAAAAWAPTLSAAADPRRLLIDDTGGNGLSTGVVVAYCFISVILVAVSGLMVSRLEAAERDPGSDMPVRTMPAPPSP